MANSRMASPSATSKAVRIIRSEARGEGDPLGRDQWLADVELDLCVREKRDPAGIAGEEAPIEEGCNAPVRRPDVVAVEALPPDVEEVAERVRALDRRLGVDDPGGGGREQPDEPGGPAHKRALRRGAHLVRPGDTDARRHLARGAPHEDREMGVSVEEDLLSGLAGDPVD